MALRSPWIEGLRRAGGSITLLVLRWVLVVIAGLPGLLAGTEAIGEAGGREPFFTGAARPMPLIETGLWIQQLPGGLWGALAAGAAMAWLGGLLLTAGAVDALDPRRRDRPRVWRAVFDAGPRAFLPYVRIALFAFVGLAAGTRALGFVFERLGDHARLAGWTGSTIVFTLPLARGALWVLWCTFVGACIFWCRVIAVADGRRRVRRLLTIVPRIVFRRPLRALLLHMAVGSFSLVLGAAVLVVWVQSGPAAPALWIPLWAVVLAVQSWIWLWRVRVCRLMWDDPEFADLRRLPDEPWHVFRRMGTFSKVALRGHLSRT